MAQHSSAVPLATGLLTAAVLSGAAALVVLQSGCEEPGAYLERDGVIELVGGCLQPSDLPVVPQNPAEGDPLGIAP
ncbi:hypothetical protein [Saccharopolyspora griseoalba]|uniref:Uncharacterized protein n=1 Tax=Saccharopolyspora griseoalba TaxID=1431848 RepID=A0ABW2LJA6_9PSEU